MATNKTMKATRTKASQGMSAVDVLTAEHEEMRAALNRLEKATGAERRSAAMTRTVDLIVRHAKAEEAVFYPAFREVARTSEDRKMFFEAHEEHHVVDVVIAELQAESPDSDVFAAKAKVLKDLVEHHAEEEEDEMFPRARKLLDAAALRDLGARLQAFEQDAS